MNTQNANLLESIRNAVSASDTLQQQLVSAKTADEAASFLSASLSIPVSVSDLAKLDHSVRAEMSDEQLEAIAGGSATIPDKGFHNIVFSVLSAGIACAIISAAEAGVKGGDACKRAFTDK